MSGANVEQRPAQTLSVPRPPLPAGSKRRIYIGEIVASATPMVVQTLLGSCVAVCLRDPATGIGGMNHILLPGKCGGGELPSRCGVNAMELLINAIMRQGGDRRRLVAKVFGAANVIAHLKSPTVGEQNAAFVRDFLATERIAIIAQRLGGTHAVQVHFNTSTGKTVVHSVDGSRLPAILSAEGAYRSDLTNAAFGGETVLF